MTLGDAEQLLPVSSKTWRAVGWEAARAGRIYLSATDTGTYFEFQEWEDRVFVVDRKAEAARKAQPTVRGDGDGPGDDRDQG